MKFQKNSDEIMKSHEFDPSKPSIFPREFNGFCYPGAVLLEITNSGQHLVDFTSIHQGITKKPLCHNVLVHFCEFGAFPPPAPE